MSARFLCFADRTPGAHHVLDEPHATGARSHRRVVPAALASRTVLQVDQAAPANEGFLRHQQNAVKTQIWIAVATYVLIAIVKKRAMLPYNLYELQLLQILSLSMFETTR
jgi:hypothetical protein